MSDILEKIVARKRERLAASKAVLPLAELRDQVKTQPGGRFINAYFGGSNLVLAWRL